MDWSVAWYNGSRLLAPLGYVPLAEFEQAYHDRQAAPVSMAVLTLRALRETRGGSDQGRPSAAGPRVVERGWRMKNPRRPQRAQHRRLGPDRGVGWTQDPVTTVKRFLHGGSSAITRVGHERARWVATL